MNTAGLVFTILASAAFAVWFDLNRRENRRLKAELKESERHRGYLLERFATEIEADTAKTMERIRAGYRQREPEP